MSNSRVAIIGAGAAGMMCAGYLYQNGIKPLVFESNKLPGRKLGITGKGRCNVTNNCSSQDVIRNIPHNAQFMYSSLSAFSPEDTMELFEGLGVPLKTERGNRVFPISDKAIDIVDALRKYMHDKPISEKVLDIEKIDDAYVVKTQNKNYEFDKVVIATGGKSYPRTGSTGDGYRFAKKLGHTVTDITPSLIPLLTRGNICQRMQGLSLKNVCVSVFDLETKKTIYSEFGEMMFTHFGVTGPVILSASSHLETFRAGKYRLDIDLKPALDFETLDKRLCSDFDKYKNKNFSNAFDDLLPKLMIPVFVELTEIDPQRKINSITRVERHKILELLKQFSVEIVGARPIDEAIITCGGIKTSEINPKTMESKLCPGLYFIGEVIDVNAYTGGFNLQIAFSSAVACAKDIYYNSWEE